MIYSSLIHRKYRFFLAMLAVCSLILIATPSTLAKAEGAGNPEPVDITSVKPLFKMFYAYDFPRGMIPMTFRNAEGEEKTLEDYRGRVVLLNFWATWCAPCAKELPALKALQDEKGGEKFTILAASADFGVPTSKIRDFMVKNGAETLPFVMLDESEKLWEVVSTGLPVTFIIDPEGRVLYKMIGEADWGRQEIIAFIDNLLVNTYSTAKN